MTQRNNHPRAIQDTSHDVAAAWLQRWSLATALVLVLVLINVQSGVGIGFA